MTWEMRRREFLLLSLAAGLATLMQAQFVPGLTSAERRTLLAIARTLFPHDRVDDGAYASAVRAIDRRCRKDGATRETVRRGVASIEEACTGGFVNTPVGARVILLKARKRSPFFHIVYTETLESLYGSPRSWLLFAGVSPTG